MIPESVQDRLVRIEDQDRNRSADVEWSFTNEQPTDASIVYASSGSTLNRGSVVSLYVSREDFLDAIPGLDRPLKQPISIKVTSELGYYQIEAPDFHIVEAGQDVKEAMENFAAFFVADYESWLSTPEDEMTEDGRELRDMYRSYVQDPAGDA